MSDDPAAFLSAVGLSASGSPGGGAAPVPSPSLSPLGPGPRGGSRRRVLVADDDPGILQIAGTLLGRLYEVQTFPSGEEALLAIQNGLKPDVILSDQRMRALPGTELIERAKALLPDTVCAIMTGYGEIKEIITGISKGEIHLYISKPWQPAELLQAVRLCFIHREMTLENRRLRGETTEQDGALSEIRGDLTGVNRDFFLLHQKAQATFSSTCHVLGALVTDHTGYYHDSHAETVSRIAGAVAGAVGFRGTARNEIEMAALLHDIGKAELPEEIRTADPATLRGQALTAYESHVARGVARLAQIARFERVAEIVAQHHERGDGTGFPNRLPLRMILRESQIVALADLYHNLTSRLTPLEISKRKAGIDMTRGIMDVAERQQHAAPWFASHGHLFDPLVYRAFLDVAASGAVPGFKLVLG